MGNKFGTSCFKLSFIPFKWKIHSRNCTLNDKVYHQSRVQTTTGRLLKVFPLHILNILTQIIQNTIFHLWYFVRRYFVIFSNLNWIYFF